MTKSINGAIREKRKFGCKKKMFIIKMKTCARRSVKWNTAVI